MSRSLITVARIVAWTDVIIPWSTLITIVCGVVGIYLALVVSPPDYQQGEAVRIMYVHVPSAWMALLIYVTMAGAAAITLIWRFPLGTVYAQAAAPIGLTFTSLCLVTGSLWGIPMWGTWWVWDARLTSVLILFFLYLGYIILVKAFDSPERGEQGGNILLMIGIINLPIIKFSVEWWNTLHQPASISRFGAPTIDPTMLVPLLVMVLCFFTYTLTLIALRLQCEIVTRRIRALRLGSRVYSTRRSSSYPR